MGIGLLVIAALAIGLFWLLWPLGARVVELEKRYGRMGQEEEEDE